MVKEVDGLEGTGRGDRGYGSTGISGSQLDQLKTSRSNQSSDSDQAVKTQLINKSAQRQSQLSQARRIISARQIQKLAKDDNPVFLAIVQSTNETPHVRGKKGNKRSPGHVAQFAAHGLTEGQKRLMNKKTGPKKDIITVKEREQQVLNSVPDVPYNGPSIREVACQL